MQSIGFGRKLILKYWCWCCFLEMFGFFLFLFFNKKSCAQLHIRDKKQSELVRMDAVASVLYAEISQYWPANLHNTNKLQ